MKTIHERLMRALKDAYSERERVPIGSQWQDDVMRQIRQLDLPRDQPGFGHMIEHLLWRMAPALAFLTVVVGVIVTRVGVLPEYDLFQALGYGISLSDFFGISSFKGMP